MKDVSSLPQVCNSQRMQALGNKTMDKCSFIEHFSFGPYFSNHIHTFIENTSEDLFRREFIQIPFPNGCLQPQDVLAF